ncbi:MAG: type II secretion system protein [Gemmatimonadota bacterium]|nr:MAG: type II secretion system protein [Gemmatimonadota bacterium]
MSSIWRSDRGTTMAEILIVLLVMGILTTAMAKFFVAQNRLSHVEEQVGFMQKNVRSAMEVIVRDVMNCGSGVPLNMGIDPLIPGNGASGSPDSIVIMANFDYQYTTLFHDEGPDNNQHVMDATGFYVGGLLYIEDFNGGEFHTITSITLGTAKGDQITISNPLSRTFYQIDTIVSPIARVSYGLSWTDPDHPSLVRGVKGRGAKVLANNIEDLQFAYILKDGTESAQPADIAQVRMVKIMMTARSDKQDCEFGGDGYRRRALESLVKPRNLDL